MAEILKLKNLRKAKLAAFSRKQRSCRSLLENSPGADSLKEALTEVKSAFTLLEQAHEDYISVIDEDTLENDGDYLETSSTALDALKIEVANMLARLLEADKFEKAKNQFKYGVENFGTPSKYISELSAAKEISFVDMRAELAKIEAAYDKMKETLFQLDPANGHAELLDQYNTLVVEEVEKCRITGLRYMKDIPSDTTPVVSGSGGSSSGSSGSVSTTKRETVMLPHFSGDEKSAYLKYPVWKKQWDNHILEYEAKYRATMLMNHLDEKAQLQIVGLENDYEEAIKKLDSYYVDAKKVVRACLEEIRAHPQVAAYDYKGLVSYKKCLVNNHARLKASDLEHEMSNTAAMGVLIRKFPIQEAVEFQKYLAEQEKADQNKPFASFIKWLDKAGNSWELLAASGTGVKGKSGNVQVHHTFYGYDDIDQSKSDRKCYKCGEEGHMKRECKKKDTRRVVGVRVRTKVVEKIGQSPSLRNFTAHTIRMLLGAIVRLGHVPH